MHKRKLQQNYAKIGPSRLHKDIIQDVSDIKEDLYTNREHCIPEKTDPEQSVPRQTWRGDFWISATRQ